MAILLNRPSSTRERDPDYHFDTSRIHPGRGLEMDRGNNIQVTIHREAYDDGLAMVTLPTTMDISQVRTCFRQWLDAPRSFRRDTAHLSHLQCSKHSGDMDLSQKGSTLELSSVDG